MFPMLVHDVMSTAPVTVSPATPVGDLLARFDRHDFNAFRWWTIADNWWESSPSWTC